jgi:hypothetical protein
VTDQRHREDGHGISQRWPVLRDGRPAARLSRLVFLRQVHLYGMLRPSEAAVAETTREGWIATQALDGRTRRSWQHHNLTRQL